MPKLNFSRDVPYTPDQMFQLVGDLEAYPRFIPNCSAMNVRPAPGADDAVKLARMTIRFGPITQAYTSRVSPNAEQGTIAAKAVDGPFSHLDSIWRFTPKDGGGSTIRFDIDFGISNPLIRVAAEPAFAAKQREILDAFVDEAKRRYASS